MSSSQSGQEVSRGSAYFRYLPSVLFLALYIGIFGLENVSDLADLALVVGFALGIGVLFNMMFPNLFWARTTEQESGLHFEIEVVDSGTTQIDTACEASESAIAGETEPAPGQLSHLSRRRQPDLRTQINRVTSGNRCGFPPPHQLGQ